MLKTVLLQTHSNRSDVHKQKIRQLEQNRLSIFKLKIRHLWCNWKIPQWNKKDTKSTKMKNGDYSYITLRFIFVPSSICLFSLNSGTLGLLSPCFFALTASIFSLFILSTLLLSFSGKLHSKN